jgi:Asp-tRNA(Asn)/Glu-tRNA(Gln) amidotransferase C subunit
VVDAADVVQEPPTPKSTRSAVQNAARRPGRITQAIKQKIDSYPGHDLARSVATNLIDKEEHIDRMMRKLEGIIAITEQLETRERDAREAAQTEPEEDGNRHLRGDLAEFSMVDLCQILIQGTKTGRLLVSAAEGEAPLGEVFFYCGSIVHAETAEGIAGADALGHVVSYRTGYFDFIFDENSPQVTIKGDSMGLLMEACRMLDESATKG